MTSTATDPILSERRGEFVLLSFNDGKRANAMTLEGLRAMTAAVREAGADESVRGIVLTSLNGAGFSAGMNTSLFDGPTPAQAFGTISTLGDLIAAVKEVPVPVATSIKGYLIGGALEIAAGAEYRVSTADAFFQMPEVLIDIPSVLESVNLHRIIGWTLTTEMLLTGDRYDAAAMKDARFLNAIAETGEEADELALEFLAKTAKCGRAVIAQQKRMMARWSNMPADAAIADTKNEFALSFAFRDA